MDSFRLELVILFIYLECSFFCWYGLILSGGGSGVQVAHYMFLVMAYSTWDFFPCCLCSEFVLDDSLIIFFDFFLRRSACCSYFNVTRVYDDYFYPWRHWSSWREMITMVYELVGQKLFLFWALLSLIEVLLCCHIQNYNSLLAVSWRGQYFFCLFTNDLKNTCTKKLNLRTLACLKEFSVICLELVIYRHQVWLESLTWRRHRGLLVLLLSWPLRGRTARHKLLFWWHSLGIVSILILIEGLATFLILQSDLDYFDCAESIPYNIFLQRVIYVTFVCYANLAIFFFVIVLASTLQWFCLVQGLYFCFPFIAVILFRGNEF